MLCTTESPSATADDARIERVEVDGESTILSAVFNSGEGQLLVGRTARNAARTGLERFEGKPKRYLGQDVMVLGEPINPIKAVAAAIARLAEEAVRHHDGEAPSRVVATYPVRWGARRQAALAEAVTEAGLASPELVPEPEGAACHGSTREEPCAFLAL